jgi:hypothetical protein
MWRIDITRAVHDRFLSAQDAMVAGALYDAGNVAVAEVAVHPGFTPQTGALQKATTTKLVRTARGRIVRISNAKPYAQAIESGARPHKIAARSAKTLRFIGKGGGLVFRRAVNHPGNRPYWFLRRAVGVASHTAERRLVSGMQELARSFAR